MATLPSSLQRLVPRILVACVLLPSCKSSTQPATVSPEAAMERMMVLMAREHGTHPSHDFTTLDGLATASLEAKTPPKPTCENEGEELGCTFEADLGKDSDGDGVNIVCRVSTAFTPFGPMLKELQGESRLIEVPEFVVEELGQGVAARFMANTARKTESGAAIGTLKFATLYARGYMTTCADASPGGRKTFERIVGAYFKSLTFSENPRLPAVFSFAYKQRKGDHVEGFRYGFVSKRIDPQKGFAELHTSFQLETDGKTWTVVDSGEQVLRDDNGALESVRDMYWADGKGPLMLSAKPSEDGRFRLKSEIGPTSDSLELTPKVPLGTELWSAAALLQLSSGKLQQWQYAGLTMDEGDPSLHYVTLTRLSSGVLLEQVEDHNTKDSTPTEAKDELYLNEQGIVTKEVTSDNVIELVHLWGMLPEVASRVSGRRHRK